MIQTQVQELQTQQMREQESLPLEQQPWYAGELNVTTASDRLDRLPVIEKVELEIQSNYSILRLQRPQELREGRQPHREKV